MASALPSTPAKLVRTSSAGSRFGDSWSRFDETVSAEIYGYLVEFKFAIVALLWL
jgi:hypothetical protein